MDSSANGHMDHMDHMDMDTKWIEIVVRAPIGALERAEAALHTIAPLGLYIEDYSDLEQAVKTISGIDLIEESLFNTDRGSALLHVYFPPGGDAGALARGVAARLSDEFGNAGDMDAAVNIGDKDDTANTGYVNFEIVSVGGILEEDWANNWKQYFKPLRVGKGMLIVPEWERLEYDGRQLPDGVGTAIRIDPGMAFGTGGHASTRLCLELLEEFFVDDVRHDGHDEKDDVRYGAYGHADAGRHAGYNVLDVGCGSGILSIAAVLLGAESALGIDIDGYAVQNATQNAALNGIAGKARFVTGNLTDGITGEYDLICANIVADIVINLFNDAGRVMGKHGAMIASGIICEREADVARAATDKGFNIIKTHRSEGWVAMLLHRKPHKDYTASRMDFNASHKDYAASHKDYAASHKDYAASRFFIEKRRITGRTATGEDMIGATGSAAAGEAMIGATVAISGDDVRHIRAVLRKRAGDRIVVCDGEGMDYLCELASVGEREATARVISAVQSLGEPYCRISLFQALPRSDKFDYVVQKCVEAGVHSITPVLSEFTQFGSRAGGDKGARNITRWRRISYEAAKQSGRGIVPEVREYAEFKHAIGRCADSVAESQGGKTAIIPYENEDATTLKSVLASFKRHVSDAIESGAHPEIFMFIGPEGGYSAREIEYAASRGVVPVTLGRRILPAETAGLAVACMIMYEFEQM